MPVTIATHNGKFHADDAMAICILRRYFGADNIIVHRTRNAADILNSDIRVDIGNKYDPDDNSFDHHMGDRPKRESGYSYAAAGLVWKHFGNLVIRKVIPGIDDDGLEFVHAHVDKSVMFPIDIVDNGEATSVNQKSFSFSSAISYLNPGWYESSEADDEFTTAVTVCELILLRIIKLGYGIYLSKNVVIEASKKDPNILIFDKFVPSFNTIFDQNLGHKFAIFPDENGNWRIQCIPPSSSDPFGKRCPLPKDWAEAKDEDLPQLSGIEDIIFVHPAAFIGGAKSKDSVLKMAKISMELYNK